MTGRPLIPPKEGCKDDVVQFIESSGGVWWGPFRRLIEGEPPTAESDRTGGNGMGPVEGAPWLGATVAEVTAGPVVAIGRKRRKELRGRVEPKALR